MNITFQTTDWKLHVYAYNVRIFHRLRKRIYLDSVDCVTYSIYTFPSYMADTNTSTAIFKKEELKSNVHCLT